MVGVLEPTGTPNDRAIFVNIEGFYHAPRRRRDTKNQPSQAACRRRPPAETRTTNMRSPRQRRPHGPGRLEFDPRREVSAVLVVFRTPDLAKRVAISQLINRDQDLQVQAVAPAEEVIRLFEGIVGNIQLVLLILAVLIVIVAGIGILVSIYNSMSDRRHEIAMMRALGAGAHGDVDRALRVDPPGPGGRGDRGPLGPRPDRRCSGR